MMTVTISPRDVDPLKVIPPIRVCKLVKRQNDFLSDAVEIDPKELLGMTVVDFAYDIRGYLWLELQEPCVA
jgi:hypothetical protein